MPQNVCETYDVDPDGDLLIILPVLDHPFAPWDSEKPKDLSEVDPAVGSASSSDEGNATPPHDTEEALDDSFATLHCSDHAEIESEGGHEDVPDVRFKVSSKHLALASPRYRKMAAGPWLGATIIHPDGYHHWVLEGFDKGALKILLDIIHGKTRKVPRSVDLEMLAKIAVLVDDLECHEEVEVFSNMWIRTLKKSLPKEYNRDLILWLLVSFVFDKPPLFKSITQTAILSSDNPIRTLNLPIREIIVAKIDNRRQELIGQLLDNLHSLFARLIDGGIGCRYSCNSRLLGALVQQMYPLRLILPRPPKPFTGFSFNETAQAVRELRSEDPDPHYVICRCSLGQFLNSDIDVLEKTAKGLDLDGDMQAYRVTHA
ncbi:hypothetical protein F5B20DRAFT_523238 [Whalleya microplaca]|nr:hypothetical protein F5B20DRAFT_523238 [Whalleya microplaca]